MILLQNCFIGILYSTTLSYITKLYFNNWQSLRKYFLNYYYVSKDAKILYNLKEFKIQWEMQLQRDNYKTVY